MILANTLANLRVSVFFESSYLLLSRDYSRLVFFTGFAAIQDNGISLIVSLKKCLSLGGKSLSLGEKILEFKKKVPEFLGKYLSYWGKSSNS